MSDPAWAYQQALFTALNGQLTKVDGGALPVFSSVPEKTPKPYLVFDHREIAPSDPLARRRDEVFVYLSVWSANAGEREVLHVLSQVDALLHQKQLPLSTGRVVRVYVTRRYTQRHEDGVTWAGYITLKALIEH